MSALGQKQTLWHFQCMSALPPIADIIQHGRLSLKAESPDSYVESQARAVVLLANGSYGVIYRSVRNKGGHCIACFGAVFAALVLTLYWAKLRFALFLVPAAEAQPAQRI